MGLKDLKHGQSKGQTALDQKALEFIGGAALITPPPPKKSRVRPVIYRRTSFSLTDEINQQIDELSLLSRAFRVTRSDVIRAGVMTLRKLDEESLLQVLRETVEGEAVEEGEG